MFSQPSTPKELSPQENLAEETKYPLESAPPADNGHRTTTPCLVIEQLKRPNIKVRPDAIKMKQERQRRRKRLQLRRRGVQVPKGQGRRREEETTIVIRKEGEIGDEETEEEPVYSPGDFIIETNKNKEGFYK